jgi:5-methylcytosine-specific restriction endonuclease McrA
MAETTTDGLFLQCDHPQVRLVAMTQSNKVVVARRQCLTCGRSVEVVPKNTVDVSQLPPWDESIVTRWRDRQEAFYKERAAQFEREQTDQDAKWWAWYNQYLLTAKWRSLRDRVMARDNHVCRGCHQARATQVHHLTYERVGNEMLFDLVAICDACHDNVHEEKESKSSQVL